MSYHYSKQMQPDGSDRCSDTTSNLCSSPQPESSSDNLMDLFAKSAKTRTIAFKSMQKSFAQRYMADYIFDNQLTITHAIEHSIKRGKNQDLEDAAILLAIIVSTTGSNSGFEHVYEELVSILITKLADQTISCDVRRQCAKSVGICCYVFGIEGYVEQVMSSLYQVFASSFAKGDGTMPTIPDSICALHSSCLQSWTLLLTALSEVSPIIAVNIVQDSMDKIAELLDSTSFELRAAAGEAIVVMSETIRTHDPNLFYDDYELVEKIRELSTDAQKSRGKKDLKVQRSIFREILATFENDESPSLMIKFGHEKLTLRNWSMRRQYDAFCDHLGTGLNVHLAENETIRNIFDLGPPLLDLNVPRAKRSDNVSILTIQTNSFI